MLWGRVNTNSVTNFEIINHPSRSAQRNGLTPEEYWNKAV